MSSNRPTYDSGAPRILIVRVGAMGDVLHGLPAVAALQAALPKAHIAWAIEPRWAPLLRSQDGSSQPLVDAVHLVEAKAWSKNPLSFRTLSSVQALRQSLRHEAFDIAIDLQGSIRSALIARASGAPRILGNTHPREAPARWIYSEQVTPAGTHVVDQAAEIVSAVGRKPLQAAHTDLPIDAEAEAWCASLLGGDSRPTVFLAPTAGWGAKQWPAERYGRLAHELSLHGYRVLVNASPHGVDAVAEQVLNASGHTASAAACTLPQLIALLRRVRLVVAGDSGPLHLAAALGVPVVALFGPTDPARNGPYGTRAITLRHADSVTDHRRYANVEAGLAQIGMEEVLSASLRLLRAETALSL